MFIYIFIYLYLCILYIYEFLQYILIYEFFMTRDIHFTFHLQQEKLVKSDG